MSITPDGSFYRGGGTLEPRLDEVRVDRLTGLLKTTRGVSVYNRFDHPNLESRGGVFRLGPLPDGLKIIQAGRDLAHHEVVPAEAMTFQEFERLLEEITLTPI